MPKKMPRRLVALSASAVASVYLAGLLSTRTAADSISASAGDPATVSTPVPTVATSGADATSVPAVPSVVVGASATATSASTATVTASTSYADGTYSGTGSSRFGNVTVSVTTSGGKIGNVEITKVTTTYPVSRIASLAAQVVQAQTASVNGVTGATASSQAFKQAVQQALAQALVASSTAAAG